MKLKIENPNECSGYFVHISRQTAIPAKDLVLQPENMNKILIALVLVTSLSTRICEGGESDGKPSSTLEGKDLCRLGNLVEQQDKVAISDIRVEDLRIVPLTAGAENHVSVKPRASVVAIQRSLLGSGAHRELHTDITLEFEVDQSSKIAQDCDLILIENLSNGIFADPFQLQRLEQQDAFRIVHIYGDVDLERPARTSSQSIVVIHKTLEEREVGVVGVHSQQLQSNVSLPLHARYPPASIEPYFQLNISMPQVMVSCKNIEDSSTTHDQRTCIHALTEVPSQTLHWFIPTGHTQHSLVDEVTTGAALAGVALTFLFSKMSSSMCNLSSK